MRRVVTIAVAALLSLAAGAQTSITVKDGMKAVSERYGVNFAYDSNLPVDTFFKGQDFRRKSLQASLKTLFAGTGIEWRVKGKYILLTAAEQNSKPAKPKPLDYEADIQIDTITAARITGVIDKDINFTQTGLAKLDGTVFRQGYAALSVPDLLKTLQTLPGVASGTELLSSLYVHGGDGSDNLYLLDGVPVYQLSHLGGIFSTFNTDAIDHVDFYKSGFPARFGGRTSSVAEISLKDGDFSEFSGQWSLGLLEGRLSLDGPIVKGKTSYALSARRSWADAVIYPTLGIMNAHRKESGESLSAGYAFMDITAKLTHKLSDDSRLSAFIFMGNDTFHIKQVLNRINTDDDVYFSINSCDNADMSWGNFLASVKWDKSFSRDLSLKAVAFWSDAHSRIGTGSSFSSGGQVSQDGQEGSYIYENKAFNRGDLDDAGLSADIDWYASEDQHIRTGANLTFHVYDPQSKYDFTENGQGKDSSLHLNDNLHFNGFEFSAYAEDEMSLTSAIKLNAGVRNSTYSSGGNVWNSLEPRLAFRARITPALALKTSYSKMSQFSHLLSSTYLDLPSNYWLPSSKILAPMISDQLAGGLYGRLGDRMHLYVEGWYKTMDNLIEYNGMNVLFPNLADWETSFNVGKGRSYGVEVDYGYDSPQLSINVYYTLSWSERFFEDIWPDWYRDRNDNRHKFTLTTQWRPNRKYEIYSSWNYHSGNRMSVATQFLPGIYYSDSVIGSTQGFVFEEPNGIKMPDYHRLDVGVNIHKKSNNSDDVIWNISVYNVYCRLNPLYAYVDSEVMNGQYRFFGRSVGIIPIVPSFSYTRKF